MANKVFSDKLRERLGSSLWLYPGLTTVVTFIGAKTLVAIDRVYSWDGGSWFAFGGNANSAEELLSTIASSVMTFMGLVFSITILALQLASNQFSPRVLRTFLQDGPTKAAMSSFVGTFVFSLALLPDIRAQTTAEEMFVPALSVFIAFVLVLVSVGFFIHYLNHMAHAIRAINIIKRIGSETRRSIQKMYPEHGQEGEEQEAQTPDQAPALVLPHRGKGGVLSSVEETVLMKEAKSSDVVIRLLFMPGDFVPHDSPLFEIWGDVSHLDRRKIQNAVLIEIERTQSNDPAFGFRQLVDIAERALSPSLNDPSTAVQALDELHDLLRMLAVRRFPSPARLDEQGNLRLILPRPGWNDYVQLALEEIQHYGSQSIQVTRKLKRILDDCRTIGSQAQRAYLGRKLEILTSDENRAQWLDKV